MAPKPLTTDAIALTEKKMDMTLDEIIKMSKPANKAKNFRPSNKNQRNFRNAANEKSLKFRHFMDTRSSLRQGALAWKRSNFQSNHFPLATEAARKAGVNPFGGRAFNRNRIANANRPRAGAVVIQKRIVNGAVAAKPQKENEGNAGAKQRPKTLDSLFADLKEQRMKAVPRQINTVPRQTNTVPRNRGGRPIPRGTELDSETNLCHSQVAVEQSAVFPELNSEDMFLVPVSPYTSTFRNLAVLQ